MGNSVGSKLGNLNMKITKYQLSALIGMIVGDGYLQKTGKKNARLRLEHSLKQKGYLMWKMSLFPNLFQGRIKLLQRINPVTKEKYFYVRSQSNSSPLLGKLRKIFYHEDRKIIPGNIDKLITHPIGFIIWYYDDGSFYLRDCECYLSLGKIDEASAINSLNAWKKFLPQVELKDKKAKGYELIFKKESLGKLRKILYWYQIPGLIHKIPSLPRND